MSAVAFATAMFLASCGGGGGGGGSDAPAPQAPPYEQARITVAEVTAACDAGSVCVWRPTAFLDDSGEATMFWREKGAQSGWHVAVNDPASLSVRSRVRVSDEVDSDLRPLALGAKRFAAVRQDTTQWTSALVDLSVPAAPSVSARVTTPLDYSAHLVSGLDGAFAVGPNVANGEIALGGNATARGVHRPLPPGYHNLWWGAKLEDAMGVTPTAWWAFHAAKQGASQQTVLLTRVDLLTGETGEVTEVPGWFNPVSYIDQCLPANTRLTVKPYGRGQVTVGWVNNKANAPRGCDVLVDGVVMNAPGASASGLPALGGTEAGPVAVWQEYDMASSSGFRVLWRQKDVTTGAWSAPAPISGHASTHLDGSATSPTGMLAIAWTGCDTSFADTCASYVSKYERGAWTTSQVTARGLRATEPALAVNLRGQAIVTWADDDSAKCSANRSKVCPQVFAYRF